MYFFSLILSFIVYFSGNLSRDEIKVYLESQLTGYKKIEFETVSSPKVKFREEISINQNSNIKLTGNTAYIPVYIKEQNSSNLTHSYITVRVKLYREVYAAKTSLKRGQELKSTDFELITADISEVRGKIITDNFFISNCKAKFNLDENTILTEESLELIPVVKRGNKVKAYSTVGNVSVSFAAAARQDGSLGDIIRIVTPDKKIFKAKVMDSLNVNIIQ